MTDDTPAQDVLTADDTAPKTSWWQRLKAGLGKSTSKLTTGLTDLFTKRKLDQAALDDLEELLLAADLGPTVAAQLVKDFSATRFGKEVTDHEVRHALAAQIETLLAPVAKPLSFQAEASPFVVLMAGVNGAGKTTTLGKLASSLKAQGRKPLLVAADTFRAAAVAQLQTWGQRAGCDVVTGPEGGDAAALAYQGLEKAKATGADIVLIDTAGRLQNKSGLMDELAKMVRVLKKIDPTAPHACLLVLDATTGQNAHSQVETFKEIVGITGLVVTKLDGSAKGGVVVALASKFGLPIHFVGVGETIDDLRPFDASDFARALMGLSEEEAP
jgi:fused signal recognition particle receptor